MNLGEEIRKLEKYGLKPKGDYPFQPRSYNKFAIHRKSDQVQIGLVVAFDSEAAIKEFLRSHSMNQEDLIAALVMEADYVSAIIWPNFENINMPVPS